MIEILLGEQLSCCTEMFLGEPPKYVVDYINSLTEYTLVLYAIPKDGGNVQKSGTYRSMQNIQISAIPTDTYDFVKWSDENTDPVRTIVMSCDMQISAIFKCKTTGILEYVPNKEYVKLS